MNVVSRRTGLSQHVIRVWEKRYGAIRPHRSDGNRRLYSDEDVHRLLTLRRLAQAGHSIGTIATLETSDLEEMWRRESAALPALAEPGRPEASLIHEALLSIQQMDRLGLEETLRKSAVAFGAHGSLERMIGPLTERVGDLWRVGDLSAAQEHFASVVIREYLWASTRPFAPGSHASTIIVTTPIGQLHELGAVIVAAAASDVGWRVIYLGPSLPPGEIAAAVKQNNAAAVALSVVYPMDDPNLPHELEMLRQHLGPKFPIIVGGRAARAYAEGLTTINAIQPGTLQELYDELNNIRTKKPDK